ncbi:helicase-related protein [Selenomonas sp. oral taxon 126]|uniref:helicase-related protein n=1 Tax=Selenomonas sp. oral taxon 126 TaxID=712528 RepID=UPI001C12AA52|nr:SNF2-related protein [Selenomonas sp. oral taxon 126]
MGESVPGGGRGAELAPVDLSAIDYAADMSSTSGKRAVFARNLAAIRVMKALEEREVPPTSEELRLLRSYSGFGGIPEAFDPANKAWSKEYDALRRHLTEAEFSSARASTLNAHYTPSEVIAGIYEGLAHIGFQGGNVLEPSCGAGRFFDAMPEEMRNESRLFGVEVDALSARIARLAHPDAEIAQQGFERTRFADGSFDLAISNVPFGDEIITGDPKYLGKRLRIHDYFLNKMIDEVRPGGLVVAITSKGTMDKGKERVRSMLADKARLVTALRLPETAFSAAGTRVISDLLVFRKKDPARSPTEEQQDALAAVDWEGVVYHTPAGENINKYFYHNRAQVLGEFSTRSGAYGREQTVVPPEGQNLGAAIRERLTALPTGIYTPTPETLPIPVQEQREQRASMGFYVEDGALCFVDTEGARSVPEMSDKDRARVISAVHLRDAGHALLSAQQEECSNEELYALQKKLTERYEDHVRRYGRIVQDKTLKKLFGVDPGSNFIAAYEIYDSKKNFIRKADIFTERTIVPQRVPTEAESAADALTISMQQKGGVDLSYMAELTGKPASDLISELEFKQIFYDEAEGYVQADAYLSGDIRGKMEALEKRRAAIEKELAEGSGAEASPEARTALEAQLFRIQKNYAALDEVKPKDLEIGDISCGLGVSWLPTRYIEQFIEEKFQPGWSVAVAYSPETGEWQVKHPADARRNPATMRWGTKEKDAYELLSGALNFRTPVVYVPTDDDKKKIVDREKTIAAQMKQQEIKDAFQEWLIQDTQRVQFITDYYNRNFNNIRPREYSGAHLHFPGMSNSISLNAHQKDAVAHSLYGGSTLFAHCVGAGKTFEMVASIMEAKRLGISHKALMIVPGHLTEQTGEEFQRLYPQAKILVATKKDFEKQNRREFIARVATQNWDAVVMSYEQFKRIKVSQERQEALYASEIERIREALESENVIRSGDKPHSVRQLEKKKKSLEAKLEKLQQEGEKNREGVIDFEELGVDRLCVDEAHYFKNLYTPTRLSGVAGIGTSESDRSWDLYLKCQYINEITNNKGVIFATGTPVSNSMTELFTMQRYLAAPRLSAQKLSHFDAWAANFGEITVGLKPEGRDYQLKTRFAKFHNLPELMNMFKEFADIRTSDMLKGTIKVPEAEYVVERIQPSDEQREIIDTLAMRAQDIRSGKKNRVPKVDGGMTEDSMLLVTNTGRNLALDPRIIHPGLPDHKDSKVNRCVENVLATYRGNMENKGTQIIFCDQSTATGKGKGGFNVYDDIRTKLIRAGIPKEQIAFVQEMKTEKQKDALFQKVREGEVRVLLGSTDTLGVGTNVQHKLVATHDLSVPWRPADLEQRMGRIIRPGNENEKVKIFRYVTEGTFDAYMWQIVENKQRFISQIMTSKTPARSMQDVDETVLSYAEIKAIATGNPFIKEKMTLENDLSRIQIAKSAYLSQQQHLQNLIHRDYPAQIKEKKEALDRLLDDQQRMEEHTLQIDGKESFAITMNGVLYTDPKEAGKAWGEMQKVAGAMLRFQGEYKGLKCRVVIDHMTQTPMLALYHKSTYRVRIGERPQDTFTRLKHLSDTIVERITKQKEDIVQTENNLVRAKEEQGRPFAHAAEEREKTARLRELEGLMRASEEESIAATAVPAYKKLPEKSFAARIDEIARSKQRRTAPQRAAAAR